MVAFREASSDNLRYLDHYPPPFLAASTFRHLTKTKLQKGSIPQTALTKINNCLDFI
jgi:hypothetical protein